MNITGKKNKIKKNNSLKSDQIVGIISYDRVQKHFLE